MMTNTEVVASAIAVALDSCNNQSWGKAQAEQAVQHATKLFSAGKVEAGEFSTAIGRLGNHSATRQYLEKQGLLAPTRDALYNEIVACQERAIEALAEATKPK